MSETFDRIRALVGRREVRISDHGYDELASDGILVREVIAGVERAQLLEETILITRRGRAFSFSREMRPAAPSTSFGASRRGRHRQPFLSQPIDLTRSGGPRTSSAGETDEQKI